MRAWVHRVMRHRPLHLGEVLFIDRVSGEEVRSATCGCGRLWMTDGGRWWGDKLRRRTGEDRRSGIERRKEWA